MFMPFSCLTKDSDYSISDSPELDRKTLSISLHTHTLPAGSRIYLATYSSPHPGVEVNTGISPQK
jgi:hypothetical protein